MNRAIATLVVPLLGVSLSAQTSTEPPQPYPTPLQTYMGRYIDSSTTASIQGPPPRTLRADVIKVAAERDMVYMIVGATFVGQTLSTYANRVDTLPLSTSLHGEKYTPFEKWVDAERSPGWSTVFQDGVDRLYDFDWDDRDYTYLAYSVYGFGIIDANFQLVAQVPDPGTSPQKIVVFRNGSSYYALMSDPTNVRLFDVTTPSAPVSVLSVTAPTFRDAAKSAAGHIAFVTQLNQFVIHTPATILANAPPLFLSPTPGFRAVTTDGTNFYAIANNGIDLHIFQPSGSTYTDTVIPTFDPHTMIEYGAGYLTISSSTLVDIFLLNGTTMIQQSNWFASIGTPYPYKTMRSIVPTFDGQQTLFLAAQFGLGDVFTMTTAHPPLTIAPQFSPSTILPGNPSLLTLTITNPTPVPVTFHLDETLPANVVSTGDGLQTTCGFGVLSAPAQSGSFTLTNATVAASSSCTATFEVTSTVPGNYTYTIPMSAIVSADNSNAAPAAATLNVIAPLDAPQVTKTFSAASAPPNTPVRMTITLTNSSAQAITGLAFTDNYPATLLNATPVNALNTCGGSLLAANGGTSLSLSGGTIPASSSCTVAVDVVVTQEGAVVNTLPAGSVTSDNADPNAAAITAVLNATANVAIPTLAEWALLALMSLLGIAAFVRLRA